MYVFFNTQAQEFNQLFSDQTLIMKIVENESLSIAGPRMWNELLTELLTDELRARTGVDVFKKAHKTNLL